MAPATTGALRLIEDTMFAQITDTYFVSPQLEVQDLHTAKDLGFVRVICNRPDAEIPVPMQSAALAKVAEDLGLDFKILPIVHSSITPELIEEQKDLIESVEGKVLAYCASGNRSTIVWGLGQAKAGTLAPQDIIDRAQAAGYSLEGLRESLVTLSQDAN